MKIRVVESSRIARLIGYSITLYPFILLQCDIETAKASRLLNHEWVHILQVRRYGFIRFYLAYLIEFLAHLIASGDREEAYRFISYERSAYKLQERVQVKDSEYVLIHARG